MKIVVIIPGFNEEKYLAKVLDDVLKVTKNIVYVDDGSTDNSLEIAKKKLTHVLRHEVNLGKGAALKTGCEYVFGNLKADAVVFMDSDGQHKASDLPLFFTSLKKGTQVVFGVRRFSPQMPIVRLIGNKSASIFLNLLFHKYIPDIPSGFKAITKKAYSSLKWKASGYEVEIEIAARVSRYNIPFSVIEIETIYYDVNKGMNLLDGLIVLKFLIQLKLTL